MIAIQDKIKELTNRDKMNKTSIDFIEKIDMEVDIDAHMLRAISILDDDFCKHQKHKYQPILKDCR